MNKWAVGQRMRIVQANMGILDRSGKKLLLIDYVMEHTMHRKPCIVNVYYCKKRGGESFYRMAQYTRAVGRICSTRMGFNPQMLVLCIYDTVAPRTYGRVISSRH